MNSAALNTLSFYFSMANINQVGHGTTNPKNLDGPEEPRMPPVRRDLPESDLAFGISGGFTAGVQLGPVGGGGSVKFYFDKEGQVRVHTGVGGGINVGMSLQKEANGGASVSISPSKIVELGTNLLQVAGNIRNKKEVEAVLKTAQVASKWDDISLSGDVGVNGQGTPFVRINVGMKLNKLIAAVPALGAALNNPKASQIVSVKGVVSFQWTPGDIQAPGESWEAATKRFEGLIAVLPGGASALDWAKNNRTK